MDSEARRHYTSQQDTHSWQNVGVVRGRGGAIDGIEPLPGSGMHAVAYFKVNTQTSRVYTSSIFNTQSGSL